MADKRISQLVERTDIANNDVVPIVAFGASTTNKATISSIQSYMQENLDVGVTSVGITLGSAGTDINVTGSPITTSGNITINIPDASATARGVVNTGTQTFAGYKIFTGTIGANQDIQLATQGTALNTFIKNINSTGLSSFGSNGFGFNNSNNIYFSGSSKGGGVLAFSNTGTQIYTLQDASGTLAFTSDISSALTGYVTLATDQTITAQKTFTTSGSSDTMIISHGSGSGFALDVIKAGNGEAIRVNKTSGSGNAMTIIGGTFEAPTIKKTGGTSSQFLMADGSVNTSVLASGAYLPLTGGTLSGALGGTSGIFSGNLQSGGSVAATNSTFGIQMVANVGGFNRLETVGSGPLAIITAGSSIGLAVAGTSNQFTLTTSLLSVAVPLEGTNGTFSGTLTTNYLNVSSASGEIGSFNSSAANGGYITWKTSGTTIADIGTANQIFGSGGNDNFGINARGAKSLLFGTNNTSRLIINSDGAMGFNYPILGSRSFVFRTISGRPLTLETVAPTGIHSLYLRPNDSGRHLISSNYLSGGVYLPLALSGREVDTDFVLATNGRIGLGTSGPNGKLDVRTDGQSGVPALGTAGNGINITRTDGLTGGSIGYTTEGHVYIQSQRFDSSNANNLFLQAVGGNVGVGTITPQAKLEVKQSGSEIPMIIDSSSDAFGAYTQYQVNNSGGWEHGMSNAADGYKYYFSYGSFGSANAKMTITNTGNVGIGMTSPSTRLSVNGTGNSCHIYSSDNSLSLGLGYQGSLSGYLGGINSRLEAYSSNGGYAFLNASSVWVPASDIKRKRNFEEYTLGIDAIMGLKPTLYNMDFQEDGDEKQVGLIAQEVKEFIPQAYEENLDFIGLNYNAIIVTMIKAIQEQQEQINQLKNQIK